MESTGAKLAREKAMNPGTPTMQHPAPPPMSAKLEGAVATRAVGYGMPCADCRAYYPADMQACPICKSKQRVSATAGTQVAAPEASPQADQAKLLAEERERLRELKSQIYASHPQVAATAFRCALDQNHNGSTEPAAICHTCYGTARQQADRMEAALHMDVRDAARIVYEAVWADPSDPNKTYVNAANALLSELRKRAGIGMVLGANQSRAH